MLGLKNSLQPLKKIRSFSKNSLHRAKQLAFEVEYILGLPILKEFSQPSERGIKQIAHLHL